MTKLAIIVHENDEVTLRDERGLPVVCRDCRFAGWLTEWEFRQHVLPRTCLHFSGGADPREGDRVVFDEISTKHGHDSKCYAGTRDPYPRCSDKNVTGDCSDFVRARPLALRWWEFLLWPLVRDKVRRRMRT